MYVAGRLTYFYLSINSRYKEELWMPAKRAGMILLSGEALALYEEHEQKNECTFSVPFKSVGFVKVSLLHVVSSTLQL
jgi:hypothetical protein